jgi:hypothetical protein
MPEIITRKDAKVQGLRYYFTGKACPQGHLSERVVFNSSCRACQREANRAHPRPAAPGERSLGEGSD